MDNKLLDPELLSEAWNQLHPSHRELIRKAHHLGWTSGETAADLNVTGPLVQSQLHYALHAMRRSLTDPSLRSRKTFKTNSAGRTPWTGPRGRRAAGRPGRRPRGPRRRRTESTH